MATSQKSVTVYAATTGHINSYSTSKYSTARSGGTLTADTSDIEVGQSDSYAWISPARITCLEGFLTFDTSEIPAAATIDAVTMYVAVEADNTNTDFTLHAGVSWTPALTTADWVAGASLGGKTKCASKSTSGLSLNTYYALTSVSAFLTSITKEGTTAILMWSSREEAGTAPSADEYLVLHNAASAYPPKLVITYTSEDTFAAERSLVGRPLTNRAATADGIVEVAGDGEICDWWFEDGPNGTLVARAEIRPTTIPRDRWYVVSRETPGVTVDVVYRDEGTPDVLCGKYKTYGDITYPDGTIQTVYYPAAPTSVDQRVEVVDMTQNYMTSGAATAFLTVLWAQRSEVAASARVTAQGAVKTVDGCLVPAPLVCAGDWIDVQDDPLRKPTPAFITGTTYDADSGTVTITTGGRERRELIVPGLTALPKRSANTPADSSKDGGASDGYDNESGFSVDWRSLYDWWPW